jgi:hypothetical protein
MRRLGLGWLEGWGGVEESMPQGLKPTSFAVRFMPGLKSGPISGARAKAR